MHLERFEDKVYIKQQILFEYYKIYQSKYKVK